MHRFVLLFDVSSHVKYILQDIMLEGAKEKAIVYLETREIRDFLCVCAWNVEKKDKKRNEKYISKVRKKKKKKSEKCEKKRNFWVSKMIDFSIKWQKWKKERREFLTSKF